MRKKWKKKNKNGNNVERADRTLTWLKYIFFHLPLSKKAVSLKENIFVWKTNERKKKKTKPHSDEGKEVYFSGGIRASHNNKRKKVYYNTKCAPVQRYNSINNISVCYKVTYCNVENKFFYRTELKCHK